MKQVAHCLSKTKIYIIYLMCTSAAAAASHQYNTILHVYTPLTKTKSGGT